MSLCNSSPSCLLACFFYIFTYKFCRYKNNEMRVPRHTVTFSPTPKPSSGTHEHTKNHL
ncbi:hypothetical protein HanOQP8_Chr12g0462101 [Helianthus annuus]|nr:hypothetical protein HanOQP8_Chr12g0462101 [Helianthus annuus]